MNLIIEAAAAATGVRHKIAHEWAAQSFTDDTNHMLLHKLYSTQTMLAKKVITKGYFCSCPRINEF